jgi:hypothetical protein
LILVNHNLPQDQYLSQDSFLQKGAVVGLEILWNPLSVVGVAIDRPFFFFANLITIGCVGSISLLDLPSRLPLSPSFHIFRLAKMYFRIGEIRISDWRIGEIRISDWRIGEIQKCFVTGLLNFRLAKIAGF